MTESITVPEAVSRSADRQQDVAERLGDYREKRHALEQSVLPLATSLDGVNFTFQASLHGLSLQSGGYVVLESKHISRLGQVVSLEAVQLSAGPIGSGTEPDSTSVTIRAARGTGVVLQGDFRPFHDAALRVASSPEVGEWLVATSPPDRAALPVGELTLAPGVPATLDAGGFDRHSFLCGQSGSGKTYSLGIMLEQILLRTSLKMVILDPNSDYVRLADVRPGVDSEVAERYRSASQGLSVWRAEGAGGIPIRLRMADLDGTARAALLHLDPIRDREEYAALTEILSSNQAGRPLVSDFGALTQSGEPGARALGQRAANLGVLDWQIWERGRGGSIIEAIRGGDFRCMVVDLGSLESREEQAVVAEAVLSALWQQRNDRQPVLIVIDEAHNVSPQHPEDPVTARATELVVRIAGEGRKYGLYLLVATQRPQKVHENVLSQCDNLVLMRMNSLADLAFVAGAFSYVPSPLLEGATRFGLGNALVGGKIASHSVFVRFGNRIAEEGGADVGGDWAVTR